MAQARLFSTLQVQHGSQITSRWTLSLPLCPTSPIGWRPYFAEEHRRGIRHIY